MTRAVLQLIALAAALAALVSALSVAGAAPAAEPAAEHRLYLPLLRRPTEVEIRTAAEADASGDVAVSVRELPAGSAHLYVEIHIRGGQNLGYAATVHTPAGQTIALDSGGIWQQEHVVKGRICMIRFSGCTGTPLPSGDYVVRVQLDGSPAAEATVRVP
jgi:hypothetical protein